MLHAQLFCWFLNLYLGVHAWRTKLHSHLVCHTHEYIQIYASVHTYVWMDMPRDLVWWPWIGQCGYLSLKSLWLMTQHTFLLHLQELYVIPVPGLKTGPFALSALSQPYWRREQGDSGTGSTCVPFLNCLSLVLPWNSSESQMPLHLFRATERARHTNRWWGQVSWVSLCTSVLQPLASGPCDPWLDYCHRLFDPESATLQKLTCAPKELSRSLGIGSDTLAPKDEWQKETMLL